MWKNPQLPTSVKALYEVDGLKLCSGFINEEKVMMILEADADHAPQWITGRLKGRLNHFLKKTYPGFPGFDRSFFFQSLAQNTRETVSRYVQNQVDTSDLVDPL